MKKNIKVGVVMDAIATIHPNKDSTLALMLEAQSRGWQLEYMEPGDLQLVGNHLYAMMKPVVVHHDLEKWYELSPGRMKSFKELDVVFMRKDPPFDMEYIVTTYLLERAQNEGVLVVNNAASIRANNEKIFATDFPDLAPPSLLGRSIASFLTFLDTHKKIAIKPLDLMGGQSIFIITQGDPNTHVLLENLTQNEKRFIQAQKYIPEIETLGDKRIILIDGTPIPYGIRRIPNEGDHRGNMAAGAKVEGFELNERDLHICHQIGPHLRQKGLTFVGIDVIGDYLTEINVTSPTGVKEIDHLFNTNICEVLLNSIEEKLIKTN